MDWSGATAVLAGIDLLRLYRTPQRERPSEWEGFGAGRYRPRFVVASSDERFELALQYEPDPHRSPRLEPPGVGCVAARLRAVSVTGPNGAARLSLLGCDGSVAVDALERLSSIATPRQMGEREPAEDTRLLHPRLAWVVQSVGNAFPRNKVAIASGFRPGHSVHSRGRALDLVVHTVSNEKVFRFCRTLQDVACGYYPNSSFVHMDVRPLASGHAFWVDVSGPGEPAHYVDTWPGVVDQRDQAAFRSLGLRPRPPRQANASGAKARSLARRAFVAEEELLK